MAPFSFFRHCSRKYACNLSPSSKILSAGDAMKALGRTGKKRADLKIRIPDRLIRVILNGSNRCAKEPL
jgi:hypothetical protein